MANRVPPVLRLAVLCEDVEYDSDGNPFAINVPTHTIRYPSDVGGRIQPPTLKLYLQLSDGLGLFYLSAEVRNETGTIQYRTKPPVEIEFDGTSYRAVPREVVLELGGMEFPGPGLYELQVKCNQLSLHEPKAGVSVPYPPVRVTVMPDAVTTGDES